MVTDTGEQTITETDFAQTAGYFAQLMAVTRAA